MEDDRDDDPFDDPVGETFHASSERWTSDCDAEEDDSRGREIDERGVVERVDVCIRGEFLRFQDGREVSVCIALSKPPLGPFDLSSVTEDTGRPRSKAARHGWIERNRVEDFLHGLWDQDGRRFWKQRSKNEPQNLCSNT